MKYAFCVAEDINLGVGYLIAYLKSQGHEVKLFFDPRQFARGYSRNSTLAKVFGIRKWLLKKIRTYEPDEIWFSCVTASYKWAVGMAFDCKIQNPKAKIVFGGVHPTLCPEEVKKHLFIDEVVVGDGIEYLGGEFKPDELFPEREMFLKELPPEHRRVQLFMTSFGCPFNCSYCGNEQLRKVKKHKFFRRSIEGCIAELKILKESGMRYVLFVDDILTADRKWFKEFAKQYKRDIDLPYACFVHPKFIDETIVKYMKSSNCHTAWMGIQTGSEDLRKRILNRQETNKEVVEACKLIKEQGIKLMVDHIFGIPFENLMTQDMSYGLYKEIKPDVINCYEMLYFPKSKIIEHGMKAGYITPMEVEKINRGEGVVYQIGNKGQKFYDMYSKAIAAIPLGGIMWELMPMTIVKLIVHLRAGRAFMFRVIVENEIYFTVKAILKKMRIL